MQTIDDYTNYSAEMPVGVHPSLVHRLAQNIPDDLAEKLRRNKAGVPATLRGPAYLEKG